jgi:hypothetical protein
VKFSLFKLLKVYFLILAALLILGLLAILLLIPRKNRLEKQLLVHPYVQEKLAEGFKVVNDCGSYKRRWNYELSSVCLERELPNSSGASTLLHEVVVHETGSASSASCEFKAVGPSGTTCLPPRQKN